MVDISARAIAKEQTQTQYNAIRKQLNYVVPLKPQLTYHKVKRVFDFTVSLFLLALLSPFMLIIVFLIRIGSYGDAIFKQTRMTSRQVRVDNRILWEIIPFTIYKFRTMKEGTSDDIHRNFVKAFI